MVQNLALRAKYSTLRPAESSAPRLPHLPSLADSHNSITVLLKGSRGWCWLACDLRQAAPMAFRITRVDGSEGTSLRLDGNLLADELRELERCLEEHEQPFSLQLEELLSADDESLKKLLQLAADGISLEGASPYLTLRLQSVERSLKVQLDPQEGEDQGLGEQV